MNECFWLRNMTVMGQGAPNSIRKLGKQQGRCLCLWSEERGFCRIYPVPYGYVRDWEIIDVEVRKPNDDGRENSFVICEYETEWKNLSKRIHVHKTTTKTGKVANKALSRNEQIELIRKLAKDTFSDVRNNKRSFGLIKPEKFDMFLEKNKEKAEGQATLGYTEDNSIDNIIMNQNDYAWLPYIKYSCLGKCSSKHPHTSKVVEWGAYQWMRTHPNSEEHCKKLIKNYHVGEEGYEHYLLIGNLRFHISTYVIVKVVRFKVK
ncbi:MAG TPA: hypothetical protein HA362_07045 [Nanoarchaeota archaeon]|nr:hypothetical protein [Nanoarchaeota archaeon]